MIWTVIATGIALAGLFVGLFAWLRSDIKDLTKGLDKLSDRMVAVETAQARSAGLMERLGTELEDLGQNVQQVAREVSELRGEVKGRLSVRDLPTAPDTGVPTGRVAPRTARGPQG